MSQQIQTGLTATLGEAFVPPQLANQLGDNHSWQWRWGLLAFVSVCGVCALAWLEGVLTDAALITPLPAAFLWSARFIGLAAGIILFLGISGSKNPPLSDRLRRLLCLVMFPLLAAVIFDAFAWRIGHAWEFALSSATYEQAEYPIIGIDYGRRGHADVVEIDPFNTGEPLQIPVPRAQYLAMRGAKDLQCVRVSQRKSASGAVEVKTNGRLWFGTPRTLPIGECSKL